MIYGVPLKTFFKDLYKEVKDDNITNGAATLAYFLVLSIFPAAIFLLSLLPYLPIPNLEKAILDFLGEVLPREAASMFTGVVKDITSKQSRGLLSFGFIVALWSASNGLYAIMQQLNITYDVQEGRPFWKVRGTALILMFLFVFIVISAFALVIFGGILQNWLASYWGWNKILLYSFAALRWLIILFFLLLGFAVIYYYGPDVEQKFRFVTPGSVFGVSLLALASLGFSIYVSNFGKFGATYGSLGALIILLLWLNIVGWVLLLGSEVNALVEHYHPEGKEKGEKREPETSRIRISTKS